MTKKRMSSLIRSIFWYLLLLLPLICFAFTCLSDQPNTAFGTFMENFFAGAENNPLWTFVHDLFGSEGILPIFSNTVCSYFTYFICVELLHVVLDVVLFLPTLLHGALDKISGKDGDM